MRSLIFWHGTPRRFGSRRHYCFSSETYRRESIRIVEELGRRYGSNEHIVAWQIDNEYGCHDTTRSWSPGALSAFRAWLTRRYGNIDALNTAWGTVFWSQIYRDFSEIDLPNLTVTEPNPSHCLDFFRFSSDQVIHFNRQQCDVLRRYVADAALIHNFMGFYAGFDHFELSKDLDIVSWDSYPLGFLDTGPYTEDEKLTYLRQGHPDFAAFHHDLYRQCGDGRWWVMEQQPGPVNWADHNPAPLPGMVQTWSVEAFAHDAETVSYFRWRQAPFAQEQNHAGLLRVDREQAPGAAEVQDVRKQLDLMKPTSKNAPAPVALVFSYEAKWLFDIQPQGRSWDYWRLVMTWYGAVRKLGLNVDVIDPASDLAPYALVLIPSLPIIPVEMMESVSAQRDTQFVFGPRSGSKINYFHVPDRLAPGPLQSVLPIQITQSESLPSQHEICGHYEGKPIKAHWWLDHVKTDLMPAATADDGTGLLYQYDHISLFTTVPERPFLMGFLQNLLASQSVSTTPLPAGLRLRHRGTQTFGFNYGTGPRDVPPAFRNSSGTLDFGNWTLAPGACCGWTRD